MTDNILILNKKRLDSAKLPLLSKLHKLNQLLGILDNLGVILGNCAISLGNLEVILGNLREVQGNLGIILPMHRQH